MARHLEFSPDRLQNYLAHLVRSSAPPADVLLFASPLEADAEAEDIRYGGHESIKVNYAKKLKWFLFLNIAWAVWHVTWI